MAESAIGFSQNTNSTLPQIQSALYDIDIHIFREARHIFPLSHTQEEALSTNALPSYSDKIFITPNNKILLDFVALHFYLLMTFKELFAAPPTQAEQDSFQTSSKFPFNLVLPKLN